METYKKEFKGESYEILQFDFIEKDGSHHGGAEVVTNAFWEKMLWDDEAEFDHTVYGYIDIPEGSTIEELLLTKAGRDILQEAVIDMDPEIIKIY